MDEFTQMNNKKLLKLEEDLQRSINKISASTDVSGFIFQVLFLSIDLINIASFRN